MRNDREVSDVIQRLAALHIEQASLLIRLRELCEGDEDETGPPTASPRATTSDLEDTAPVLQPVTTTSAARNTGTSLRHNEGRPRRLTSRDRTAKAPKQQASDRDTAGRFEIGDKVRVKNPRFRQAATGTVHKIGRSRITVKASDGSFVIRDPKNLAQDE